MQAQQQQAQPQPSSSAEATTATTTAAATAPAKPRYEVVKEQGNTLFQENQFGAAIDKYTEAIEEYNRTPGAEVAVAVGGATGGGKGASGGGGGGGSNKPRMVHPLAVLYSNRAFANIKMETYGAALDDATKALEFDTKYPKAYYRRGSALLALGKAEEAENDFRAVLGFSPRDTDAISKVRDCELMRKKLAFQAAISGLGDSAMAKPPPPLFQSETIAASLPSIKIDPTYTGFHWPASYLPSTPATDKSTTSTTSSTSSEVTSSPSTPTMPTVQHVAEMMAEFKKQNKIHIKYAYTIVLQALALLKQCPTLVEVKVPPEGIFNLCGDVHGQFFDLCKIFELNGLPSETNPYLFNGDFVDRGSFSCEIILTLFALKVCLPNAIFLARGNHETASMNKLYGFEGECKAKYSDEFYTLCLETFAWLPLAHVLRPSSWISDEAADTEEAAAKAAGISEPRKKRGVFVVHGGLPVSDVSLAQIKSLDRVMAEISETGLASDLLWSDPQAQNGKSMSKRGVGYSFGPDITQRFLTRNKLGLVVRSHEVKPMGHEVEQGGLLVTVFSAPNYCGFTGNKGCILRFSSDLSYTAVPFEPASDTPKDVPTMAYAGPLFRLLSGN
ncbi:Serine/threonine-protein phosphatase 5 [Pelomyxa schiedti]|nr:Serine/threonine-protein phosphatase 5 [Pelomyxa schiedti]